MPLDHPLPGDSAGWFGNMCPEKRGEEALARQTDMAFHPS